MTIAEIRAQVDAWVKDIETALHYRPLEGQELRRNADVALAGLARQVLALTDSAGELVRLRDSQQKDLEALLRSACGSLRDFFGEYAPGIAHPTGSDFERLRATLRSLEGALPSSSVSPSLTETGMGFECPRGHRHFEGSAFCTVCGAGPVLEAGMGSGQKRPAPDGEAAA